MVLNMTERYRHGDIKGRKPTSKVMELNHLKSEWWRSHQWS